MTLLHQNRLSIANFVSIGLIVHFAIWKQIR